MVKFGLQTVPAYPAGASAPAGIEAQIEHVRLARDAGFSSVWVAQHFVAAPFQYLQTVPVLGRLTAEAGEMTVGTCVLLLPLAHPVRVAEEMATVDILSNGRLILGVGAGYSPQEMIALGLEPRARLGRYVESLDLLSKLWSGDPVTYSGKHFQLEGVQLVLRPVQRPRPPIWIGAQGDKAIERAARLGDVWIAPPGGPDEVRRRMAIYRAARSAAGREPPPEQPARIDVFLGEDERSALAEARPCLEATYGAFAQWGLSQVDPHEDVSGRSYEEWARERIIVGDPDYCLRRLEDYRSAGVDHFIFRVFFPGVNPDHSRRTMRLLERHVVPAVRG